MPTPFTLEDIDRAHQCVDQNTVSDYLKDLRKIGVVAYATFISDGHSEYFDCEGNALSSEPIYERRDVSDRADADAARKALDAHSSGDTDYFAFTRQLADAGVCTWVMDPVRMTCAFCSKSGEPLFVEAL